MDWKAILEMKRGSNGTWQPPDKHRRNSWRWGADRSAAERILARQMGVTVDSPRSGAAAADSETPKKPVMASTGAQVEDGDTP
eukprot:4388199-Pyramimonas_sp.AAC.1